MELQIIGKGKSLEEIGKVIQDYFGEPMQIIQINMSMFEQYQVRPVAKKHIKGIWQYRIVVSGGAYNFGRVLNV